MIKVLLVDDQELVRRGLQRILGQEADINVVAECNDGSQVLHAVQTHKPDIVLMDVRMKQVDGITATRELKLMADSPPVMMLTTFGDDEVLWNALEAGAAGFVLKDSSAEELVRAIRVISEGGAWLDPAITGKVIEQYQRLHPENNQQSTQLSSLTTREHEVLVLLAQGLVNREIADHLFVSEATVKTHISHIFNKLDTRDRAAAIVFAYNHGVVSPRSPATIQKSARSENFKSDQD